MSGVFGLSRPGLSSVTSWLSFNVQCDDYLQNPMVQKTCETASKCIALAGIVSVVAGIVFSSMTFGVAGFVAFSLGYTNRLYITHYGRLYTQLSTNESIVKAGAALKEKVENLQSSSAALQDQVGRLEGINATLIEQGRQLTGQNTSLNATVLELRALLETARRESSQLREGLEAAQAASLEAQGAVESVAATASSLADVAKELSSSAAGASMARRSLSETVTNALGAAELVRTNSTMLQAILELQGQLASLEGADRVHLIEKLPALKKI
jgi:predicted nuclease with TOPRIM domain